MQGECEGGNRVAGSVREAHTDVGLGSGFSFRVRVGVRLKVAGSVRDGVRG